ncbi:MAG: pyridoxal-phosphate dependent enzyme [Anaerolineales bacterium]|nr:pyridoxal-phosphate dependent enzyme [Anaerolineales bacterium]
MTAIRRSSPAGQTTTSRVVCTNCGLPYPPDGLVFKCPACGGLFDYACLWTFDPAAVDRTRPGIFRYWQTYGLPPDAAPVSLGEGDTPLVWAQAYGRRVAFKCEFLNPTGSFKDRGSALIATWLQLRGIHRAIEDSSGNAGASLAAYAARAGIRARVFVPAAASGPKRVQIEALGAELIPVPGSRADVTEAVRREAERGGTYASHAALPFNLPGYASAAYELVEQLGGAPGALIVPAGQGGFLLGLGRGFDILRIAGVIERIPILIGVQARACAPLWALNTSGTSGLDSVTEGPTLAEGVRVRTPLRAKAVLQVVTASGGTVLAVDEQEILPGRRALARLGLYVEPTSAIVWPALGEMLATLPDPVVAVLTGSGYKFA